MKIQLQLLLNEFIERGEKASVMASIMNHIKLIENISENAIAYNELKKYEAANLCTEDVIMLKAELQAVLVNYGYDYDAGDLCK